MGGHDYFYRIYFAQEWCDSQGKVQSIQRFAWLRLKGGKESK
jgi:hypothetical protein